MKKLLLILSLIVLNGCDLFRGDNPTWRGCLYLMNRTSAVINVETNIISLDIGYPFVDYGTAFELDPGKGLLIAQSELCSDRSQISLQSIIKNWDDAFIKVTSGEVLHRQSKTWVFSPDIDERDILVELWDYYEGIDGDRLRPPMRLVFNLSVNEHDVR